MDVIFFALYTGLCIAAGAYLEHKFGAKLAARVAALEAHVVAVKKAV